MFRTGELMSEFEGYKVAIAGKRPMMSSLLALWISVQLVASLRAVTSRFEITG